MSTKKTVSSDNQKKYNQMNLICPKRLTKNMEKSMNQKLLFIIFKETLKVDLKLKLHVN